MSAFCAKDEFNELANLFFVPQDRALKMLFSRASHLFSFGSLAVFFPIYFIMIIVTSGMTVAGGLFVPMMLAGASYGRFVGLVVVKLFPNLSPPIDDSIYAVVGAGAMMAGFSRSTISLCVIILELTENAQFLLPIMFAVMFAKWVGDGLSKSLYEDLIELKSIIFLDHHPPHFTYLLSVTDVMAQDVTCLNEVESLERIVEILQNSKHNGFPVVQYESEERDRTYKGFILRKQLLILIEKQQYQPRDTALSAQEVLEYGQYVSLLNKKWTFDISKVPNREQLRNLVVDLRPYMDQSTIVIHDTFSFINAYRVFQTEGLRHLPVINKHNQVVGIVTRHDLLIFFDDDKMERLNIQDP